MKFPVDLLADVSQTELERLAHNYMNNLLYSNPDAPEHLSLPDSTQVTINICNVGFVPLYGSSDKQKVLALFSPTEPLTAVALYLLDQWWPVDDILKTADRARDGAVEVETVGERIVLYILNRVVYRAREMSSEELPFLCHREKDHAKIFWSNGEAVGFYSVKPSGSFSNSFATRSYQLPVMDSIFVRRCQRGKGFGLQMLEDFVLSFKEDCLGLRYPLSKAMYKVCEQYLRQYPGDTDLLWEVESIGGPNQRTNMARKIQAMDHSAVSRSLSFTEESPVITEMTEKDVGMEAITTQIKKAESMECTVEIVEEVTVLSATKSGLEAEVPLTARGRSSGSKRRKTAEEKVIRVEDIEAETPREEKEIVSESVQTEAVSVAPEEQGQDVVDTAANMSEQPDAVLKPQDTETADVTSAATTEEAPVGDSQITVENVASEIEDECPGEDTAAPAVSEEMLELHTEAETLDKVGEETPITDEKWEKGVPQHEVSPSEESKAGRTTGQSKTPRRRNTHVQEGVKEDTAAQEGGISLRRRTVMNTPRPKRKYTKPRQKVCDDSEKEVEKVAEENYVSPEGVEELAKTGEQAHEQVEEQEEVADRPEEEIATEELRAVEEETIPKAEEAAGDVIASTGGNEEESKDETEHVSVMEAADEGEAVSVSANADDNTVAVETAVRDTAAAVVETAVRQAEESQENDPGSLTSKLQKATVILLDIKTTCHHLSVKEADETAADGQSADAEKQQEGEDGGKQEDITATCVEAQTAEKEQQDNSEKEESVEEEKSEAEEALIPETKDDTSEGVSEEAARGTDEVEEKQAADGEPEDADASPPAAEVAEADKTMSLEEEEAPVVETRALRSRTKTSTAPKSRSRRSKKQPEEEEEGQREFQKQEEGPKESAEEAEEETGLRSVEDPPTEAVTAEAVEASVTEEEAAEDSAHGRDTDTSLPKPNADSTVLPPSGEEELRAARFSVSHMDVQEDVEALPAEPEEKQKEEAAIAEEDVPKGTENTELEKVTVEEEDKVETIPTADPGEGRVVEEEAEGVNDEEQEDQVPETRVRRSRKHAGPATPTSRLTRSRQENAEVAASESQKSTVQVRVLRGRGKLIPVTQRPTTKRTHPEEEGEEGGDESAAGEARETEEVGDQQQAKRLDERDATERVETMDKEETGTEEAVLQLEASEQGQAHRAGTAADVDKDVGQPADEGKSSDVLQDVVPRQETVEGEQSTSAVMGSPQETPETAEDGEEKDVCVEEEATRGRTKNRREEEAAGETSSEVGTRVLRKGRRSAAATPHRKPKRVRTQPRTEEEEEEEAAPAEETQAEETKADKKEDNSDEKTEEDGDEAAAEQEEATQPEVEMEKEEAVAEEEDRSAVSETCEDGQGETSAGERAVETPNTDEGKVTDREEAASVETAVLRSGKNTGRSTTRSKTTKRQEEEAAGEKSTEDDEPVVESRVLRGGKRSAAATPRRKSKRVRTQPQTKEDDEEEEEASPAEETPAGEAKVDEKEDNSDEKTEEKDGDGDEAAAQKEEEAGQEPPEEKGEPAEEEEKKMEIDKEVLEEESAVGDAGQMKEVVPEEEDNRVEETASAEVEETKSAEEEEEEEETPAVISRALRRRTRRSRRGRVQTQQQEEEEEEEGHLSTGGSPRRSVRKKPRVDYRENNEEGERGETEVTADQQEEDTEDGKALSNEEQSAEKMDTLSLVLDTDEEEEAAGMSAEDEKDVEPVVIGERVLRGRSVPSVVITPQAKSTRSSARVQKAEEEEEKSLRSAQKRRRAEGTPARRSQRRSRV
ncbi:apoptotic chromatin condensation inducer in the nucleus-like [Etheostoma cragini]|uniref:apoptotic chromatin condensation inducer in the nucleus-like n=1 Tax=Etheostoma cragini TaxID=417921 RepID=UPI00155EB4C3|nr:apoptotic chromatin condensation inducer in the nucleus-like [Etheostoma cragini]